jgi:glycosyltransferase involved in cell wall biosynthesis
MDKFLVCVRCTTFNQSAYITDALNGFAMQQTDFPFVTVVIDDASTDGEQEVIKAYVNEHFYHSEEKGYKQWETEDAYWTFACHKKNENCHFVTIYLKRNLFRDPDKKNAVVREWMNSKYVALCEGDDYWTDPLKLQKQVTFLEAHPDYSMCIHGADVKNESKRDIWAKCEMIETREYFSKDVFPDWIVPTASIIYRNDKVSNYPIKHGDWFVVRDIVTILKGTHTGRVWGMAEHMSVYRMNDSSLMAMLYTETVESQTALCRHYKALMLNFPQVDRAFCNHYIASFNYSRFRQEERWAKKLKHFFIAVQASPKYVFQKFWRAVFN